MAILKTNARIIAEFKAIHGDRYDYALVEYAGGSRHVNIICRTHGVFKQQPRAHLAGQGCPACTQRPNWAYGKRSLPEFIDRARGVHGDRYSYARTVYTGTMNNVIITCGIHGDFTQRANSHLNGRGCPKCAGNQLKTTARFIEQAVTVHGDYYDYSAVEYRSATAPVTIICPKHGAFKQSPRNHLAGKGCHSCGVDSMQTKLKATTAEFVEKARAIHGDVYDYSESTYVDRQTPVTIVCKQHGPFQQRPGDHINGRHGCPSCGSSQLKTTERFIGGAREIHGDRYGYDNATYVNSKTDLNVTCRVHGDFAITPAEHLIGRGCPSCGLSSGQSSMLKFVTDLGYTPTINDRTVVGPLEIDIYLPERRLGIEYHGSYWHSYDRMESSSERRRHAVKAAAAAAAGIKLLQFYDFEWLTKRPIVESMIRANLNLTTAVAARSCTVTTLDRTDALNFFTANHLQGHRDATVTYTALDAAGPVCALALAPHPRYGWEIIRFASRLNTRCIGGFGRLLKRFLNDWAPAGIVTYANRRYSSGNVYRRLGFFLDGITTPGYTYVMPGRPTIVLSRQRCQRSKLPTLLGRSFNANLTEAQNMFNAGYRRLWDAGHYRFVYRR